MVREACIYDLDRVLFLTRRGLYFAAFDWLYKAYREFIQALFIARRTYPISYTKWIREQLLDRMALPEVYDELPRILEMTRLEGADITHNADRLRRLVDASRDHVFRAAGAETGGDWLPRPYGETPTDPIAQEETG